MSSYSIKDLEQLSGIRAHTLRIWEQRYQLITPHRTETNIRYYSDADLKLILNISLLNKRGFRIGAIAKMSAAQIAEHVQKLSKTGLSFESQINMLTTAMMGIDEYTFEKVITEGALQYGFETMMTQVIYPFLERIGVMWMTGSVNPAQEHFISNLIRQKIIVAIDGQVVVPSPTSRRYLLFLPEGEFHEFSLLYMCYLLKNRHNEVIYLGTNVPLNDIIEVAKLRKPDYVYVNITSALSTVQLPKYLDRLSAGVPHADIYVSGQRLVGYKDELPLRVKLLNNMQEILDFIDNQQGLNQV